MSLVEVRDLATGYDGVRAALRGVTFRLEEGEAIAVLGPNGGGKTTLLRVLLGELAVIAGTCSVGGRAAYVAQSGRARLDFPVSALDVVLMGAYARTSPWRRLGRGERSRATEMLDRVGLAARAGERFGSLSGGQRQRVLIARALLQDAPLLLLDEPFTGVDRASEAELLGILDELRAEGRGLLVSTHDIEHARRWDRVLCLNGVQIAFGPPTDALTPQILHATYGEEMVTLGEETVAVHSHHHHD
jgi:ABC-type Mn2+/Zn2+ transport system ATPase subunit